MKVRTVSHGRIKERYNPVPNAAESRHEARLREMPCVACGGRCEEVHHVMQQFPGKRFRRDHRFQIPLCSFCHQLVHKGYGSEAKWGVAAEIDVIAITQRLEAESVELGILPVIERRRDG